MSTTTARVFAAPAGRPPLSGIWLPLITPFRDGFVDEPALRALLLHYLAAPVDGSNTWSRNAGFPDSAPPPSPCAPSPRGSASDR